METNRRMREDRRATDQTKMNSLDLQKNFYSVYKGFFNTHDIILSGNNILTWGSDISNGLSILQIKQKLPIKAFCGANFNKTGEVIFKNTLQFSVLENTFKKDAFSIFPENDRGRIAGFLKDFLREKDISTGVEIDFLFEVPPGHGFGFSSTVSVLLSTLFHTITGDLDVKSLEGGTIPENHPMFETVYKFSLQLSNCISEGRGINSSNYGIMLPSTPLPIVYFSGKDIIQKAVSSEIEKDHDTLHKDTLLNFLGIKNDTIQEIPLDYGVIFTGMKYRFSEITSMHESLKNERSRLDTFIGKSIYSLPIQEEGKEILLKNILSSESHEEKMRVDDTNFKILEGFDYLFNNLHNGSASDMFIDIVKKMGLANFAYHQENKLFFSIQYLFYRYRRFEDEEIGIMPFNTGSIGGSLFFVMKTGKSRETLTKVLSHLQNEGHTTSFDYASWRDGTSSDGICVEQYIKEKIYSKYTKSGSILFSDTFGNAYCSDYDNIIENERDCILLDTIQNRIYIGGKKLTSKEIHSQNTTIDMLRILLENLEKEVPNSYLPVSTYSQNKNEILSKVVLPIKKLTKEHFGKEMPLTCSGGITEYYLRLDRDDTIRIGLIKKLQSS